MSSNLSCRYYADKFPAVDDTVMVKVNKIAEMGAYVTLTEYNDIEGMILLSELSRLRIRSVNKLIKIGRSEIVVVIRVDENKGYIDLSKRQVDASDRRVCEERFAKAKAVNGILKTVAAHLHYDKNEQLEELYQKTAWHFDQKFRRKAASYDIFKMVLTDSNVLDECDISPEVKKELVEEIRKKLTPQAVKIRAEIEVSCFAYEGIEAIKTALVAGKRCSSEEIPIKISLIAPPLFVITAKTMEKNEGIEAVNKAIEAIKTAIELHNGKCQVKIEPKVTDEEEEARRKNELLELEEEEPEGEAEDDDGLVAPQDLDRAADAEEMLNPAQTHYVEEGEESD